MNNTIKKATDLLEVLPESDQKFALEFIQKLVVAWDPDYTKSTPAEHARIEEAEKDLDLNETIFHDEIDWN